MLKISNEVDRRRVRRTLTEVKDKLEEALRLSEQLQQHKGKHGESTPADHRR
ncbi:MAG TPA: hypothetical protein VMF11_08700 [Candidatus Baltobacteraceae bacterium]|nr:hypothetical protein [Candidatus Baltobacteraceae bacterium]